VDIEHIRMMIREGLFYTSKEFNKRSDERGFTLELTCEMIKVQGRIVEERKGGGPYHKCTVQGAAQRTIGGVTILDELTVSCAMGDEVVFITGYWESDRPRRGR
jgi:hypothetical protein